MHVENVENLRSGRSSLSRKHGRFVRALSHEVSTQIQQLHLQLRRHVPPIPLAKTAVSCVSAPQLGACRLS